MTNILKQTMIYAALLAAVSAGAQTLSPQVSPSSGGYTAAGGVKLSWTMGQTFNSTLTGGSSKLTQGFEQPEIQLTTGSMTGVSLCQGAAVQVPYTALSYVSSSNVFTAQLSDSSGSFSSPVAIGQVTATASGNINATIPLNTPLGSGYRIRVVSSAPLFIAGDDGTNLSVNNTCLYNTWLGLTSAWATASNWSFGTVPSGCASSIKIPATPHSPVVSSAASVGNVQFTGSSTLTLNAPLSVCGSWTGYDTAIQVLGNSYLTLAGTSQGLSKLTSFNYVEVTGSYTVGTDSASRMDVRGILKATSGTLTTSDHLTLKSIATQSALIWDNGGNISGNATVEHYEGPSQGGHHYASSVTGATLANLTGIPITGADGIPATTVNKEGTVQVYDEPLNTTTSLNSAYYNYTSPSHPLTSGMGVVTITNAPPVTMKVFGAPTTGPVSYTITKLGSNATTAGWNLIGNPYPSPISWTAIKNANAGVMNATCYIWKPTSSTAGAWQSYNGTAGTNGVGDVIAEGQGFFILKTNAGSTAISFSNTMRNQNLTAVSYKNSILSNEIRLAVSSPTDAGSEAVAYTAEGATEGFDNDVDGPMPPLMTGNESPSIAYSIQDQDYLIHVTDAITSSTIMPLSIHTGAANAVTVAATSLNVTDLPVYIYDNVTGSYTDMSTTTVTVASSGSSDVNGRYSVVFSKKADITTANTNVNIYGKTGIIAIERTTDGSAAQIIVSNLLGQQIINTTTTNSTISLPVEISDAIYIVSVRQAGIETVKKVFVK